ncbi:MAG: hypothetical protein EA397_20185 [Deltaproteobacteria bacterium]|nr:MAG: hypothetical protein EA397_20185 [Deltaproteobacteria bacterium]
MPPLAHELWAALEEVKHPLPSILEVGEAEPRNIYWIVLDGYGREDVLLSRYKAEPVLAAGLRERGFFVAAGGRADYAQTALAMASMLNVARVEELLDPLPATASRQPLRRLVRNNRVIPTLRSAGYRVETNRVEYSMLNLLPDSTHSALPRFTEFEHAMIRLTPLEWLGDLFASESGALSHSLRRAYLKQTFDYLAAAPKPTQPTFTFVHIISPHPPFVFNRDGTPRPAVIPYMKGDGSHWHAHHEHTGASYIEGYREMALWTGYRTLEVVDHLQNTDPEGIIVIHSDHGGGHSLDWDSRHQPDVIDRMAILNALFLPGQDESALRDDLTPIGSMRVVLNHVLSSNLGSGPLPSTFSTWFEPYHFIDVTSQLQPIESTEGHVPTVP